MIFKVIDISNVSLALLHWKTYKFVDEGSARTHEEVVYQNPGLKRIYAKILRSMCAARILL